MMVAVCGGRSSLQPAHVELPQGPVFPRDAEAEIEVRPMQTLTPLTPPRIPPPIHLSHPPYTHLLPPSSHPSLLPTLPVHTPPHTTPPCCHPQVHQRYRGRLGPRPTGLRGAPRMVDAGLRRAQDREDAGAGLRLG